jgi:alkanesulfonate monooxygenase
MSRIGSGGVEVFSTCPLSRGREGAAYLQQVADVARWSEQAGCRGILVYSDNGLVDPWLVPQLIIQATEALCPLVAVQPVYMHPYSAAKMVATLGQLHGRRVYLNMLAGGFKNDLVALNDTTPHDERYERTVEYTLIVKRLLFEPAPVSFAGRYYQVDNLKLTPSLPEHLLPGMLISGSSPAGLAAARAIAATAVQYPEPAEQMGEWQRPDGSMLGSGSGSSQGIPPRPPRTSRTGASPRTARASWPISWPRRSPTRTGTIGRPSWAKGLRRRKAPAGLVPSRTTRPSAPTWSAAKGAWRRSWPSTSGWASGPSSSTFPPSKEELDHIGIVFREALGAERR